MLYILDKFILQKLGCIVSDVQELGCSIVSEVQVLLCTMIPYHVCGISVMLNPPICIGDTVYKST